MAFWIIVGLSAAVFLSVAFVCFKDREFEDGFASLGIGVIVTAMVAFLSAIFLSMFSFGWSDFKHYETKTYTLAENARIVDDTNLDLIIVENGVPREIELQPTELRFEGTGKSEVVVEYYQRSAPGWVPWGTGTEQFVTIR